MKRKCSTIAQNHARCFFSQCNVLTCILYYFFCVLFCFFVKSFTCYVLIYVWTTEMLRVHRRYCRVRMYFTSVFSKCFASLRFKVNGSVYNGRSVIPEIFLLTVSGFVWNKKITKELSKDIVCIFDIIYVIPCIII